MAVFITCGHGHIGSWAAYFLAKEGEQIIKKHADWMKEVMK